MRHEISASTALTLNERKNGTSWRKLAIELSFEEGFAATLCAMSKQTPGCASLETENKVRIAIGLCELTPSGNPKAEERRHRWSATEEQEEVRRNTGWSSTEFIDRGIEAMREAGVIPLNSGE